MPRINVVLTGSSASLERSFARGATAAKAFNVSVGSSVVNLRRLEPAMAKVGSSLTKAFTLPAVAVGVVATKMAVDFNKQMLLIQTQAGASAGEVKRLSGEVLNLAKTTPQGPTQLAEGLYHLESLGLRGAKAMDTLRISALAAGMGIADLESTTTALGGVVVTGIKGAQNYQSAMATLVATVGAGNVRMEDLAGAIGNITPAAAAAGVTLPELGAAIATLTDRGFSADEATTRLRMSLSLIQAPSQKARKALKDMGVNAESLGGVLRSPNGLLKVLEILHAAIERVGKTRGNRDLLQGFGGGKSGLGIQTLVQSLDSGLSSFQSKLTDVSAGEKKYAANQKAYLESPSYKLAAAWSSVQVALVKLGAAFVPVAVRMANAVGRIADAFSRLPRIVKVAIGSLIAVFAIGGPLLVGLAAVIRSIIMLRVALASLGTTSATSAAETEASLAGIGAAADGATAQVGMLRGALAALTPLAAAVALAYAAGKIDRNGGYKPNAKPFGGHRVHKGGEGTTVEVDKNDSITFGKGGQVSLNTQHGPISGTKAITLAQAAKRLGMSELQLRIALGMNTSGMSNDPMHDAGGGNRTPTPSSGTRRTSTPHSPGLDQGTKLDLAVARANRGVARGDAGAKAQLVAALKAKIDFDRKWEAKQQDLIRRGVGDAKTHAKIIQALVGDETSAYDQINSLTKKADSIAKNAGSKRAAAFKKADLAFLAMFRIRLANAKAGGADAELAVLKAERAALHKRLDVEKGNMKLQQALADVNAKIASIAAAQKQKMQQALDSAKSVLGDIGQGPVATGQFAQVLQQFGAKPSAQMFTQDLAAQNRQGSGFLRNLNRLRRRGAPAGLIQTLLGQGQGGMDEASALAGASKAQLHAFLKNYKTRQRLLQQVAHMEVHTPMVTVRANNVTVGKTDAHDRPGDPFTHRAKRRGK